jgi:hypothetical protein
MSDYYPPAPEQQWSPPARSGSSGKAIAALVLGIVGVVPFCPLLAICSLLALIFGILARKEITASGGMISGGGMALAGIILGAVGLALWVVLIIVAASTS